MTLAAEKADIRTIWGLAEFYVDEIKKTRPNPVLYDLGCGNKCAPGFRGVDLNSDADVRADLFAEWTFAADDSVDMFYTSHFLEHVPDLNKFMESAWRKLRKGGLFLNTTPYGFSVRAWQDPTHIRPIFRETYHYFSKASRERMGVDHYESGANFDIVDMWPVWNKRYATRAENNPDLAEKFMETINAVDDLTVLLRAVK